MQLKTIRASNLAAALKRARTECGPHALVLATNEVAGRMGMKNVEITVALERPASPQADPEVERLSREVERLRSSFEGSRTRPIEPAVPRIRPVARAAQPPVQDQLRPAVRAAVDALIRSGLSRDLALRFARSASDRIGPEMDRSQLALAAESAMRDLLPFVTDGRRPKMLFVVGPPGAGKSTTAVKLATRSAADGTKTVLANADQHRLGAAEQAWSIARRFGLPFQPVRSVDDLAQARVLAGPEGTVIVDTPGVGASDDHRLSRLAQLCRSAPDSEVLLILPAGIHTAEARQIVNRFSPTHPTCVALSRVDDGGRIGELVNALADSQLPLAFLTTGHRVPADLEEASPRRMAALLLRSGFRAHTSQETQP